MPLENTLIIYVFNTAYLCWYALLIVVQYNWEFKHVYKYMASKFSKCNPLDLAFAIYLIWPIFSKKKKKTIWYIYLYIFFSKWNLRHCCLCVYGYTRFLISFISIVLGLLAIAPARGIILISYISWLCGTFFTPWQDKVAVTFIQFCHARFINIIIITNKK